jgi:hypothetical protein
MIIRRVAAGIAALLLATETAQAVDPAEEMARRNAPFEVE